MEIDKSEGWYGCRRLPLMAIDGITRNRGSRRLKMPFCVRSIMDVYDQYSYYIGAFDSSYLAKSSLYVEINNVRHREACI